MNWWRSSKGAYRREAPITEITSDGVTIKTPIAGQADKLAFLRMFLQQRQPLPEPKGEVIDNPRNAGSVREYTAEEREQITKRLNSDAMEHDRDIARRLQELENKVREIEAPALGGDEATPHDPAFFGVQTIDGP